MLFENFDLSFGVGESLPEWEPTEDELACAVELNLLNSFRSQFRLFRQRFGSFREMLEAPPEMLDFFPSHSLHSKERFLELRKELQVGREYSKIPSGVEVITYFDRRFPASLREIRTPPPVLYVHGNIEFDHSMSISIVGSRTYTDYGRQMAERFAYHLASWGFTIISGGARGIDSFAHKAALDAKGKTIAVFGCGIDFIFPRENKKLFEKMVESGGAVVSEFPVGTVPEKYNFPLRNRLIAALGRGTLVVEAGEQSGALITAELASEMGKDVFAVPGRLTDMRSRGTNLLIRDGAHIVLDPLDIPISFGLVVVKSSNSSGEKAADGLRGDEALVYESVTLEAKTVDTIVQEVGLPASRVLSALLMLQTRGLVRELSGSRFVRPVV